MNQSLNTFFIHCKLYKKQIKNNKKNCITVFFSCKILFCFFLKTHKNMFSFNVSISTQVIKIRFNSGLTFPKSSLAFQGKEDPSSCSVLIFQRYQHNQPCASESTFIIPAKCYSKMKILNAYGHNYKLKKKMKFTLL